MSEFVLLFRSTPEGRRAAMGTPERAQQSLQTWLAWIRRLEAQGHLKSRGQPLDLLPLEVHAGRDDDAVVREITIGDTHATLIGVERLRQLVPQDDPVGAQSIVAEGEGWQLPHAAQHEIGERARHEPRARLEQHDLDRRIRHTQVLGSGGTAPAAADHDHAPTRRRCDLTRARAAAARPPSWKRTARRARCRRRGESARPGREP